MAAISPEFVHQTPFESCRPSMVFFLRHWLARWWKYFVFLSPVGSQMNRDCWHQNTSSWCRRSLISHQTSFILSKFSPKPAALSSSSSPCLAFNLSRVFPKVYLLQATRSILHLLIFSNKQNIGLPIGWHCVQEVLILSSHSGWATHFSSKRWSFVFRWWRKLVGSVVNKMGLWSE